MLHAEAACLGVETRKLSLLGGAKDRLCPKRREPCVRVRPCLRRHAFDVNRRAGASGLARGGSGVRKLAFHLASEVCLVVWGQHVV